ncbi:DegV family protein [uncultured Subdoligranulum sp.]|uniref:DegV family protein n=1 Tax=uncultured Subdoligranulum sp. TaxID=512298 RepID=UPI0025EBB4EE|nr:DegV family protein [uncultured Subdoligranulum sp.]
MERKIAIVTDSSCDIPKELAEKYGIDVIDFPINLDGKEYYERRGMTMDQFYELMRAAQGVPTTAAITALQWREVYEAYADQGYTDVLHVSINSTGSSTYANAQQAAEQLRQDRPEMTMRIHLVDSHTYSMVFGWYLCECARKLRNGGDLRSCILELESKLGRVEVCLAAFSLKQLKKSGRVSAAAAFAGELLGLRPVISLTDGVSKVEAKVRGDAAVIPAMLKWIRTRVDDLRTTPYLLAYTSSTQKRDELLKLCKKEFGHPPMYVFQLGGVVSANTGPDCIAIAFEGKPRRLADYEPPLP